MAVPASAVTPIRRFGPLSAALPPFWSGLAVLVFSLKGAGRPFAPSSPFCDQREPSCRFLIANPPLIVKSAPSILPRTACCSFSQNGSLQRERRTPDAAAREKRSRRGGPQAFHGVPGTEIFIVLVHDLGPSHGTRPALGACRGRVDPLDVLHRPARLVTCSSLSYGHTDGGLSKMQSPSRTTTASPPTKRETLSS